MAGDRELATAQALREAFDGSFAALPSVPDDEVVDLLVTRAGDRKLAWSPGALAGVDPRGRLVPVGDGDPALLGLAGARGHVVAVWDPLGLLGAGRLASPGALLVLCRDDPGVALACDGLDGYLRVPSNSVVPGGPGSVLPDGVRGVLAGRGDEPWWVDVPWLLAEIRRRVGSGQR